ncbi:sulfatase-like hydrolase/transferase [candidate division KSB1 bacterium]|nr:sulfatase-like hydrolase/transferase [candidate division KSB1 bacterium]
MPHAHPNILWLMTDEQRCDSLGCYGSAWAHTPNLDALANQGVLFENAHTPAPVCVPARTSVLTARYPSQTGVWHNNIDPATPVENLMGHFRHAGYRTASFGKQHYVGTAAFEVEAGGCLSKHVHYFGYDVSYREADFDVIKYPGQRYNWIFGGRFPADSSETAEAQVIEFAKDWLERNGAEQPFFLRISFNGPHTPVVPPEPFDTLIPCDSIHLPEVCETLPENCPGWLSQELIQTSAASPLMREQILKMRQYYYGEVSYLDSLFGELITWMAYAGLLENTIVVFWSDHGTHLGDYGLVQKQTFFEPVVRVPFFFWYPEKLVSPKRIKTPVETRAMLPTLLELAQLPAVDAASPGLTSMLLSPAEPEIRPVFSEFTLTSFERYLQHSGRLVLVRDGDWKLSACLDPEPHDFALYHLAEDPFELENLADDPNHAGQKEHLLHLILTHLQ